MKPCSSKVATLANGAKMPPPECNALVWDEREGRLWGGAGDGCLYCWSSETWEIVFRVEAHEDMVSALAWAETARVLVSGSEDGTIALWNADTGVLRQDRLTVPNATSRAWVGGVIIDEDSRWVSACGGLDSGGPLDQQGLNCCFRGRESAHRVPLAIAPRREMVLKSKR
jgi:WD40 repeat protein